MIGRTSAHSEVVATRLGARADISLFYFRRRIPCRRVRTVLHLPFVGWSHTQA